MEKSNPQCYYLLLDKGAANTLMQTIVGYIKTAASEPKAAAAVLSGFIEYLVPNLPKLDLPPRFEPGRCALLVGKSSVFEGISVPYRGLYFGEPTPTFNGEREFTFFMDNAGNIDKIYLTAAFNLSKPGVTLYQFDCADDRAAFWGHYKGAPPKRPT